MFPCGGIVIFLYLQVGKRGWGFYIVVLFFVFFSRVHEKVRAILFFRTQLTTAERTARKKKRGIKFKEGKKGRTINIEELAGASRVIIKSTMVTVSYNGNIIEPIDLTMNWFETARTKKKHSQDFAKTNIS